MIFPYFSEKFDPQEQKEFTWRFKLLPGESIATSQIDQTDMASSVVLSAPDVVLGPKTMGLIGPQIWGVTQWFLPMSAGGFTAYVRCMVTTDYAGPIPHIYSRTMRLQISDL